MAPKLQVDNCHLFQPKNKIIIIITKIKAKTQNIKDKSTCQHKTLTIFSMHIWKKMVLNIEENARIQLIHLFIYSYSFVFHLNIYSMSLSIHSSISLYLFIFTIFIYLYSLYLFIYIHYIYSFILSLWVFASFPFCNVHSRCEMQRGSYRFNSMQPHSDCLLGHIQERRQRPQISNMHHLSVPKINKLNLRKLKQAKMI